MAKGPACLSYPPIRKINNTTDAKLKGQQGDEVPIISLWFMITLSRIVQFFFKIKEVNKENTFVSVGGVFRGVLSIWIIGIILWIAIIWARIHRDMNTDSDMIDQQIYYMVWYDTGLMAEIVDLLRLKFENSNSCVIFWRLRVPVCIPITNHHTYAALLNPFSLTFWLPCFVILCSCILSTTARKLFLVVFVAKPLLFWAETLGARHTECVYSRGKWQRLKNSIVIYTCVSQQEAVLSVRCVRRVRLCRGSCCKGTSVPPPAALPLHWN